MSCTSASLSHRHDFRKISPYFARMKQMMRATDSTFFLRETFKKISVVQCPTVTEILTLLWSTSYAFLCQAQAHKVTVRASAGNNSEDYAHTTTPRPHALFGFDQLGDFDLYDRTLEPILEHDMAYTRGMCTALFPTVFANAGPVAEPQLSTHGHCP